LVLITKSWRSTPTGIATENHCNKYRLGTVAVNVDPNQTVENYQNSHTVASILKRNLGIEIQRIPYHLYVCCFVWFGPPGLLLVQVQCF
jgi:hypothetical protein